MSPSTPFAAFFRKKPGSKPISLPLHHCPHKPKLYWDFTWAHFSPSSAEPVSNFYLAVSHAAHIQFLIGDLREDAFRRSSAVPPPRMEPALLSRREHVFGQRTYMTKAWFLGSNHEIVIQCVGGAPWVKVDGEVGLVVKRLAWKFQGNERISWLGPMSSFTGMYSIRLVGQGRTVAEAMECLFFRWEMVMCGQSGGAREEADEEELLFWFGSIVVVTWQ